MERYTISLEPELAKAFDQFIGKKGYSNRSEAVRDLIREKLEAERLQESESGHCIAALSYIYNHHASELASRITSAHHAHHELTMSSMHVHMDHDNCLEIVVLRGLVKEVQDFANAVMAVRGVRHGSLSMVPIEISEAAHSHDGHGHGHTHTHHSPKT
jgi:CopG family nickel-responsive transcriptional regulator